jgi:hypothetical protein
MSSEENKLIALSLLQALNARDLSVWSKYLAEDYIAQHIQVCWSPWTRARVWATSSAS